MDKIGITREIIQIVSDMFEEDLKTIEINAELSTFKKFDSLEQLNLYLRVEEKLSVNFDMQEIIQMKTISDIVESVLRKL